MSVVEAQTLADVWAKGVVVAVGAVTLLVLLRGGRRRPAEYYLAAFLALIAGNFLIEAVRPFLSEQPAAAQLLGRMAAVMAAVDPLLLYYFVSIAPGRSHRPNVWALAIVGLGCATMAAAAVLQGPAAVFSDEEFNLIHGGFTALAYTAAFMVAFRTWAARPDDRARTFLVAALAFATVPAVGRACYAWVHPVWSPIGPEVAFAGTALASAAFPLGVVAWWAIRRSRGHDVSLAPVMAATAAAAVLSILIFVGARQWFYTDTYLGARLAFLGPVLVPWYQVLLGLRWIFFSLFITVALVRHRLLDMEIATRRTAARLLVAVWVLGCAGYAYLYAHAVADSPVAQPHPAVWLPVLVILAVSQGFHRILDHVAHWLYGVPPRHDSDAAWAAFREASEQCIAAGRHPLDDARLEKLRRALGLPAGAARAVADLAAERRFGSLRPGQRVADRYRIDRLIAEGSQGRTFAGHDERLARPVALKEVQEPPGAQTGALREAQAAARVAHPNVLQVHDVVTHGTIRLIITPLVTGGTLQQRLQQGPLPLEDALGLMQGILAGLQAIHDAGLVHGDLKPANILLNAEGSPLIADFGIATDVLQVADTLVPGGGMAGTLPFMAPEQLRAGRPDPAWDVFAAGRLLEALTTSHTSVAIGGIIRRACADDPRDRWPGASAMADAVRTLQRPPRHDRGRSRSAIPSQAFSTDPDGAVG